MPSLYDVEYADTRDPGGRWVTRFEPREGASPRVKRLYVPDLSKVPTSRVVDTPGAQFGDLFLTEVARGCLWGCRFCAAGFVQRPYREVDLEVLRGEVRKGIEKGLRIGLVGPDTSDYTGLDPLTCFIGEEGGTFSPSSLRVDAITPELAGRMAAGGERSITIAPEAGTDRMRKVVNKDFSDDRIVEAAENALSKGMRHVKLYFMCGLPTETDDDVLGMAVIALRIRDEVMKPRAKVTGRMGRITLSVNPFVPKPWTPFQWAPMHDAGCLAAKRRLLEKGCAPRHRGRVPQPRARPTCRRSSPAATGAAPTCSSWRSSRPAAACSGRSPAGPTTRSSSSPARWEWTSGSPGTSSTTASTKSFLAREYRNGVAARITPKCTLSSCRACGLDCADHPELAPARRRSSEFTFRERSPSLRRRHARGPRAGRRGGRRRRGPGGRGGGPRGRVVGRGRNRREEDRDPTAHAELLALQEAARTLGRWRLTGVTLVVTLEPCAMCAGALVLARVDRLVYGAPDPKAGAVGSLMDLSGRPAPEPPLPGRAGAPGEECGEQLRAFFRLRRATSGGSGENSGSSALGSGGKSVRSARGELAELVEGA